MADSNADVVVLGAGPVGLTLAVELARRGVRPVIVDKAPGIREVSKALILHVRTQEALARVGIAAAARAEAQPLTEVVVNAYGKFVGSWDLDDIDSPCPHPLILGQNRTQHLLLDRLAALGVAVGWNAEATALALDTAGATVTLGDAAGAGRVLAARYVIGCEGSNSLVRKTAGFSFEGERYSGEQFIQADCRIRWALPAGRSYLFLTDDGYMMLIEMPDGMVRLFISLPDNNAAGAAEAARQLGAVESATETPTLAEVAAHFTRLSGLDCTLTDPVWLARYRTSHRYADRFRSGPAFVAGDAGHVHVPIGGQGMNTGIQDAFNLGWKLAGVIGGTLRESVLDSYQAERHPVAKSLINGTDLAYRGILHPSELRQRAARLIGPFLLRSARVQGFMRDTLEELSVAYPASPLNLDLGGAGGPAPGERMLDAPVVAAADMATTSLWAAAAHDQWTLLLFLADSRADAGLPALLAEVGARFAGAIVPRLVVRAAAPPAGPGDAALLDVLGRAHDRYGVSAPALLLVRPDMVIAARAPLDRWPAVAAHAATIFA